MGSVDTARRVLAVVEAGSRRGRARRTSISAAVGGRAAFTPPPPHTHTHVQVHVRLVALRLGGLLVIDRGDLGGIVGRGEKGGRWQGWSGSSVVVDLVVVTVQSIIGGLVIVTEE